MEFSRYFHLILKNYWLLLLFEVLALTSTYYYTENKPASYTAQASLFLNPNVINKGIVPYISSNQYDAIQSIVANYDFAVKTEDFATKVTQQLDFPISPQALLSTYTTKLVPNTYVYNISATSNDPVKAQKIANAVAKAFLSLDTSQSATNSSTTDVVNTAVDSLRKQLTDLQAQIDGLHNQLNQLELATPSVTTADALRATRQTLNDTVDLQSRVLTAITQVQNSNSAQATQSATIAAAAQTPALADDGGLVRNLIFSAVIAFALAIGVIILLDFLDYTVRSSEDLTALTAATTLGVIPVIRPTRPRELANASINASADGSTQPKDAGIENASPLLVTANEFKSGASESYRALRTNVLFSTISHTRETADSFLNSIDLVGRDGQVNTNTKTLLITSSMPREGKSMTTANLAVTFAQAGNRVIVVDTDLRQPTLHKMFGMINDSGFSNLLLAGPEQYPQFIKKTNLANLAIITAGNPPPNPSELLTSNRATEVIRLLREAADIVIFDSPPIMLVSDAAILATRVDGVLLIARSGRTRRDTVSKAAAKLRNVKGNLIGTVLNYVQGKDDGGYYYYSSYGYGNNTKNNRRFGRSNSVKVGKIEQEQTEASNKS